MGYMSTNYPFLLFDYSGSNELGDGNLHAARVAVVGIVSFAIIETSIVSATFFVCHHGYVFSNEKEVVDYVTIMGRVVCLSVIVDSIQGVVTGKLPSYLSLSKVYIE